MVGSKLMDRNQGKISPNFFQPDKAQIKKPFALKKKMENFSDKQQKEAGEGADQENISRNDNTSVDINAPSPLLMNARFGKPATDFAKYSQNDNSEVSNPQQVFTPETSANAGAGQRTSPPRDKPVD